MKDLLTILKENNFTFEYGQREIVERVLFETDDYYNGLSSYKIGYYWYSIIINGIEYDLYTK